MAGIPLAGRYADPYGFSQNPYADPHALAGYLTRYTAASTTPLAKEALSVGYYNSGFLSGLGGALKAVGPYIAAAGSIAAEVLPAIYHTGTSGATQAPAAGPTGTPTMVKPPAMKGTSLVQKVEQVLDPAILGGPSFAHAGRARYAPPGTKGYHPVKKGPHAGLWVRNRHRNVANIHALRRSLSRIHGFEKICRKVVHFVHPKRAVGHAVFKRRRRS